METISLEPRQISLSVGIEVAPPLLQTMYKEPTMIIQSYGINAQEGGQMSQVLTEHAQTLGTTHRVGAVVKFTASDTSKARSLRNRICATSASASPRCVQTRES